MSATFSSPSTYRVPTALFQRQVYAARLVYLTAALLCWIYTSELNALTSFVYERYLLHSPLFKHDSFEPLLSTFTFGVVMAIWICIDFYLPWLHRYRISPSNDVSAWKGRENTFWRETFWYISPWLVIDQIIPRRRLPPTAPTFPLLLGQIGLALVVFDLIFFIGHRAFHAFPWLYKHVHAAHHSSPIIRATDSIRHTFWDGTWDVICSVLALNLTRAHPLSRALYNIVAISLIAEAHGGLDLPWAPHNIFPYVLAGPITHDAHHRLGRVNYQKYFMYLDWACGTLRVVPRFPGTPYESHESQESQAGSQGTKGTKQL